MKNVLITFALFYLLLSRGLSLIAADYNKVKYAYFY